MSKLSAHPGIVVGVDGSPASKAAVQWAARDAELRNVTLTLVHVVTAAGMRLGTPLRSNWTRTVGSTSAGEAWSARAL